MRAARTPDSYSRPVGVTDAVVTPIDKVIPHGKTAKDRCDRCFQIPASNGVCGCP